MSIALAALAATGFSPGGRLGLQQQRGGLTWSPRACALSMAEQLVLTDGTDSFFASRSAVQALYDFGDFSKITALSSSVTSAKKMLLSRQARYSGLIDILEFSEAEVSEGMSGASVWVAINGATPAQIAAAGKAGVKRCFVHVSAADADDDAAALESALQGSGMTYTLMRTGPLVASGDGAGLILGEFDQPVCGDVPKEDVFRFITESLTVDEAGGRSFSLCPSADDSQLREMRMAGCSRRDEVEALLTGKIKEKLASDASEEEKAAVAVVDEKSAAEEEAKRAEELKMLLERAKVKGIENQKKMAEEEAVKAAKREERQAYFKQMEENLEAEKAEKEGGDDEKKADGDDEKADGDGGDKPAADGDGDGDKPDEPPLAMA